MQNSTKYDVIIVGAGIAGCYVAAELAKLGYSVCVLEKNAEAGAKSSCTGIISRQCLDLLTIAKDAIQFDAYSARVFSPSGKYIRVKRDNPQAYVMDRPSLDRSMASEAANNGAFLSFSTLVSSIKVEPQFAEVHATRHNETLLLKAEVIVIAGGTGTVLARDAGLGQIDEFAQGAQANVLCRDLDEVEVYTGAGIAPGFFAWLVPAGNSRAKAGLLCRGNPRPHIAAFFEMLEQRGRIIESKHEVKYGAVPLKPLPRTFGERILVVGDSAGQVKPTTGGGIYFGILCAGLAVRTIHEALGAGSLSALRLSVYQKRWHKLLKQELSIDYWAHRFYSGLDDKQVEHIFDIIERHGIHESILASPDITFDWHGKVILDALKYRSLQRSLEKLGIAPMPSARGG
jgi:digeranylgeranylglycerophospholipid reductase